MAAGIALPPTAFCETLIPGMDLTATASPQGREIAISAPRGSYVFGEFLSSGSELTLTAQTNGRDWRELARASAGGMRSFQFVVPEASSLNVRGDEGAPFSVRLLKVIAPEDQHPAPIDYLSPAIATLAQKGPQALDAFWSQRLAEGTPIVETTDQGTVVTFLYRGASRNVRLFGGPGTDHDWLTRLAGTDLWFKSYIVPADTRLSYQLAPDVPDVPGTPAERRRGILATAAKDPANPQVWPQDAPDDFNRYSVLELPDAPKQPGYPALAADVTETEITSDILGNTRRIQFFTSDGFDPHAPDAILLFVFDGPRAVSQMQVPGALRRLVSEGCLPPTAAVFIDPIDSTTRAHELPGNPDFARFMAEELLPFAARHLGITPDGARTVVAGASYGGIGAMNVALSRPDLFGVAVSMSGSYWWAPEGYTDTALSWMAERVLAASVLPRTEITAGTFETARAASSSAEADIRETSRQLYGVLRAKGAGTHWREYAGGHDGIVWRGALMDSLISVFGTSAQHECD